jgi:hypothetical protein
MIIINKNDNNKIKKNNNYCKIIYCTVFITLLIILCYYCSRGHLYYNNYPFYRLNKNYTDNKKKHYSIHNFRIAKIFDYQKETNQTTALAELTSVPKYRNF